MAYRFRENTASGRPKEPLDVSRETGAASVGKILGAGEPGKAQGFRPGGYRQTGYNTVGGKSGMQVKIPTVRDQSAVHSCPGVDPENVLTGGTVEPTKNNA